MPPKKEKMVWFCCGTPEGEDHSACIEATTTEETEDPEVKWYPRALQYSTLRAVQAEAIRAHKKHKTNSMLEGRLDGGECLKILVEEVGEVARAMTYDNGDLENLREELVQVAAMASSWYDFLARDLPT